MEVKDLWQQLSELRDNIQSRLDKINEAYGLKKYLTCSVAASQSKVGTPLAIVEIPNGEQIDWRLKQKFTGPPPSIAKQVLPVLDQLLKP
ncbi:MAG: hypothetical protein LiPW39_612 [Parcubacteria group bacterium LiPW_39]|nr:MAG: hypothetical protein LiPW39_612 [Parcubacteria group bacterium LiPW_39]